MTDQTPDEVTVGQTAAVAKLYSLAVLDEVRSAAGKFLAELDDIKRRYERELSTGPDQFTNLLAMAERVRRDTGSKATCGTVNPVTGSVCELDPHPLGTEHDGPDPVNGRCIWRVPSEATSTTAPSLADGDGPDV